MYPNWDFCFENKPFGNPGCTTLGGRFVLVQIKAKSGTKAITLGMRLFTWTSLVMSFQKGLKLCSASISFS
jgi:hypothetical protein